MVEHLNDASMDPAPHSQALYDLVEARASDEFVFTSSGAEGVNQAIWSVFLEVSRKKGKTQFITSCIEDAPTLQILKRCEELGCKVLIAPVGRDGRIDLEKLAELITPRTALISVTAAQGLTGVIQPVEQIGALAKEKGVLFHLEASYAIGKTYFSFGGSNIDYLTFSGERIHSVRGTGALFVKKGRPLVPLILGGGSFDLPALAALGAAAGLSCLSLDSMGLEGSRLRDLFETELERQVPGVKVLFRGEPRLPNTTAMIFPKVHAEALDYFLERKGVHPNMGGGTCQNLKSLLSASGIETESALSFSLSRMTTEEEILRGVSTIVEEVKRLQLISEDLF
jgi:cysteine desulfurase